MRISDFIPYCVFVFFLSAAAVVNGEEMDAKAKEMMAKWQTYATPGANHKVLDALVGQWTHAGQWWTDPNAEPETFAGSSEVKWIMGGRFLQHFAKGPGQAGQPFEGMGIVGYDNIKKKYQSLWIDNMGTGMMQGEGTYDAEKKELNDRGSLTDPIGGSTTYRGVYRFIDANHYKYEMFTVAPDGKESLSMTIDYTRKK